MKKQLNMLLVLLSSTLVLTGCFEDSKEDSSSKDTTSTSEEANSSIVNEENNSSIVNEENNSSSAEESKYTIVEAGKDMEGAFLATQGKLNTTANASSKLFGLKANATGASKAKVTSGTTTLIDQDVTMAASIILNFDMDANEKYLAEYAAREDKNVEDTATLESILANDKNGGYYNVEQSHYVVDENDQKVLVLSKEESWANNKETIYRFMDKYGEEEEDPYVSFDERTDLEALYHGAETIFAIREALGEDLVALAKSNIPEEYAPVVDVVEDILNGEYTNEEIVDFVMSTFLGFVNGGSSATPMDVTTSEEAMPTQFVEIRNYAVAVLNSVTAQDWVSCFPASKEVNGTTTTITVGVDLAKVVTNLNNVLTAAKSNALLFTEQDMQVALVQYLAVAETMLTFCVPTVFTSETSFTLTDGVLSGIETAEKVIGTIPATIATQLGMGEDAIAYNVEASANANLEFKDSLFEMPTAPVQEAN